MKRNASPLPRRLRATALAAAASAAALWAHAQASPPQPAASAATAASVGSAASAAASATGAGITTPIEAPDDTPCDENCRNQRIATEWARQSGQPTPHVSTDAQGRRRLEWRGSVGLRLNHKRVQAGEPGRVNTPAQSGSQHGLELRMELQLPDLDGPGASAQLAAQHNNDAGAAANYPTQLQNFSAARQGSTYAMQFGDYAANFSQLGLQLGYRGVYAHREFGGVKAAVIGGTLAESWDSLANRPTRSGRPARTRYLRDISGLYLGYEWSPRWRIFSAMGAYRDRESSLDEDQRQLPLLQGRSLATGLQFRGERLNVALEWASNGALQRTARAATPAIVGDGLDAPADDAVRSRSGAMTLDASYRFEAGQLRLGARRIGTAFSAASPTVQPGAQEEFVAGDWSAAPWLQFSADVRHGAQRTAATRLSAASRSSNQRVQLGANVMLQQWVEGLGLNLQASQSEQRSANAGAAPNRQSQHSLSLNWQRPQANVSVTLNENLNRTPGVPTAHSDSHGQQAQLGLPFGRERPVAGFSGQVALTAGAQRQRMNALDSTSRNRMHGITAQAQREGWGQFSLSLQEQVSAPPLDAPRTQQRQLQLDAQRPLLKNLDAKLSARWAWHNRGVPASQGQERALSLDLQSRW